MPSVCRWLQRPGEDLDLELSCLMWAPWTKCRSSGRTAPNGYFSSPVISTTFCLPNRVMVGVLVCFGLFVWTGSHYVHQAGRELTEIHLCLPSGCWGKGMQHHAQLFLLLTSMHVQSLPQANNTPAFTVLRAGLSVGCVLIPISSMSVRVSCVLVVSVWMSGLGVDLGV